MSPTSPTPPRTPLLPTLLLATALPWLSSCVHLRKTDREFKTSAALADDGAFAAGGGEAASEAATARPPGEPSFEKIKIQRSLDRSLVQTPLGPYRVGPGDELEIEVAELAETRARTRVMPDGVIHYNVAPGIPVQGMTIAEISAALSKALADDYVNPVVSVNVAKADSQRFWILGQVRQPGAYPIARPTTLIAALSAGGGLLSNATIGEVANPEAADLERAILIRDGALVPVNFERLVREGDMSQNVYVKGGDYIFVPSIAPRSVYVLGHVVRPGPVFFEKGTSLVTAVASAGGPQPDAIVTKALIMRGGTLQPEVATVNLRAVMRGQEPDLRLEGGDIVWVPRSPWTKLERYLEAVLITAAQAVAVQEGLGALGSTGAAGVTIIAGGN
jgi:polysaccharide export outer membrane protein